MKKFIIILIAVVLTAISIITVNKFNSSNNKVVSSTDSTNQNNSDNNNQSAKKAQAIDFKLKDLNGNELSLSSLKGKKVFLNFWATWCPPCKSEMPEIEKLYEETKDSNLIIVAVEIGEPLNTVKPFIDSNKYKFKVLLDSDNSVADKYKINSIPTSYFIDTEGNIISEHLGAMTIDQMKEYIKNIQ